MDKRISQLLSNNPDATEHWLEQSSGFYSKDFDSARSTWNILNIYFYISLSEFFFNLKHIKILHSTHHFIYRLISTSSEFQPGYNKICRHQPTLCRQCLISGLYQTHVLLLALWAGWMSTESGGCPIYVTQNCRGGNTHGATLNPLQRGKEVDKQMLLLLVPWWMT